MVPNAAFPPTIPLTDQVTAELDRPITVTVNVAESPARIWLGPDMFSEGVRVIWAALEIVAPGEGLLTVTSMVALAPRLAGTEAFNSVGETNAVVTAVPLTATAD